ncbi:MAG: RNA 2',3'-cyclic phosphodiesterase [Ignavibacteriae bacterium]|nr:MAG: RNA 2',3'-cyclic phosphodiesterase [Ignavibacteriota bacterium]
MPALRTFIALPTPSAAQHAIAAVQTILKETNAGVKWESQDKFHITLVFLGNVEPAKLELLSNALKESVQSFPSFGVQYESVGAFPNPHQPRVIWIGIPFNQSVLDLQANVGRLCSKFGFPEEDRVFHPHITLGRVKDNRNMARLTDAIKTITFEPIETTCPEILLMKSDLHPGGSIYTKLKSFPLHT